jgi:fumarylacetoacetase
MKDTKLESWLESANDPRCDFPIQNLPLGVFTRRGEASARIGVAIGDQILDVRHTEQEGLLATLPPEVRQACAATSLNALMALGRGAWSQLRGRVSQMLRADTDERAKVEPLLVPMSDAEMMPPVEIGDYTDFYSSIYHATNVGKLFRPDNPLLPNYKYVPIAYHGRASSIVVSGTPVVRPYGQAKDPAAEKPSVGPSKALDYELEVGFFIGPGNRLGEPISIANATGQIFGLCLLNDWSARDIQSWEYQPLGPFLAKSFATSISPWIVSLEALEPFRVPAFRRPDGDPGPLPYLSSPLDQERGGIDVTMEVHLSTRMMRDSGLAPAQLCCSNLRDLYWTLAQMVTHHTSNGCNLRPGDLLATGTVSGPTKDASGCLLELTQRGAQPVALPSGETRKFLEDGDEVILRGYCEREGFARVGFGECRGTVVSAVP